MPKKLHGNQIKLIDKAHEKTLKTVAKGAGIGFLGIILGKFFAYLTRVFIARSIGPETYGLISIGIAIISILTTFSLFGFKPGLTRFIAFYRGKKDLGKVMGSIFSSFKMALPVSISLSLIIFLFSENIALVFSKPDLTIVIKILALLLPFSVVMNLSYSSLLGFKLIKEKVYVVDIGRNLSILILVVIFFILGLNLIGATLAFLIGGIIASLIGVYYIKNKILSIVKTKPVAVGRELFSFSWPLLMVTALYLIISWTDILILGYFDTSKNVGIYSAALNTCVFLTFILEAFCLIFIPIISELFSQNKLEQIRKIYKTSTRWVFSMTLPLFLLFVLFPDNILKILFGKEFVSGSLALIILSVGYFTSFLAGLSVNTTVAIGKPKVNFYLTMVATISNLILNIILIPFYGMVGAAIAMMVALILWNSLSQIYLYKKIKTQPYGMNYFKPVFASLLSVSIFYYLFKIVLKTTDSFLLLIGFLFYIIFYAFLFLAMKGLNKEDLMILKSIERKMGLNLSFIREFIKKFIK